MFMRGPPGATAPPCYDGAHVCDFHPRGRRAYRAPRATRADGTRENAPGAAAVGISCLRGTGAAGGHGRRAANVACGREARILERRQTGTVDVPRRGAL